MSTAAALGFKLQNPAQSQQAPEAQINTDTSNATPEANSPGMAYMSTEPGLTVTLSTEAAEIVEAIAQEKRESLARRITGFEKAGHVRPEIAKRERDRLPNYKPAIDPISKRVSIPEGMERLELLAEGANKRAGIVADLTGKPTPAAPAKPAAVQTATLSTATPEDLPGAKASDGRPNFDLKLHIRELATAAGLEMVNGAA
jgi:hypothetical protein